MYETKKKKKSNTSIYHSINNNPTFTAAAAPVVNAYLRERTSNFLNIATKDLKDTAEINVFMQPIENIYMLSNETDVVRVSIQY